MIDVELQNASSALYLPSAEDFRRWAIAAVKRDDAEIVIRLVDEEESAELNSLYRGKSSATNVLSFPFEAPPGVKSPILGDLVICAPVVEREAVEQGKAKDAHWAHMVVHGILHLQAYDHIEEHEAVIMESEEIAILNGLGFANPYEEAGT
ncbi:MAG: rRNA maturation RNase YbeY [Methylococcaceae bacterium]|nr:rRNA maturation RNase YbeY [Methylococcaceae bacterium]